MRTTSPILVTGAAGFIGFHLSKRLLEEGYEVVGLDNLNPYYDVNLKKARLDILKDFEGFSFAKLDLEDVEGLKELFETHSFEYVVNLAAQAGVRYSLENPFAYTSSNITGFVNILERSKDHQVKHVIYASSSSVYGANTSMPFSVSQNVDHPISLYAATKKANELIAHSYASNFKLPVTGLRFFTVYGPWGRPDMALFIFTKAILEGRPIDVYNNGKMRRDFTFVDDIVEGIFRLLPSIPKPSDKWDSDTPVPNVSFAPYALFNIGNNSPVELMDFIKAIEVELGKTAEINFMPLQKGDVPKTFADVDALQNAIGYKPSTNLNKGVKAFIDWYKEYYKI